jgi:ribonuclease D
MIRRWLKRLFGFKTGESSGRNASWPTREEINLLPEFDGLGFDRIIEILTPAGAERAYRELVRETVVGFDTESKPTFVKGHVSTGPHVAQFATRKQAYVFQLHHDEVRQTVGKLISLKSLTKVGFGLRDDLRQIRAKLKVHPRSVVDLETLFSAQGHGRGVGVKVAVAIAFKKRFRKSKKASTSNWMNPHLTDAQLLYAANDAYAAIAVFDAMGKK